MLVHIKIKSEPTALLLFLDVSYILQLAELIGMFQPLWCPGPWG